MGLPFSKSYEIGPIGESQLTDGFHVRVDHNVSKHQFCLFYLLRPYGECLQHHTEWRPHFGMT